MRRSANCMQMGSVLIRAHFSTTRSHCFTSSSSAAQRDAGEVMQVDWEICVQLYESVIFIFANRIRPDRQKEVFSLSPVMQMFHMREIEVHAAVCGMGFDVRMQFCDYLAAAG
jgi:hypothetical protein